MKSHDLPGRNDPHDTPDALAERRRGLYAGVSDELAELMRTGWADTERRDLAPVTQAPYTAARRSALSAAFPGERLIVPAGCEAVRVNDTNHPFRAASAYVHLTGDQSPNGVLVLEPRSGADGGHEARLYLRERSNRENGEFWQHGGELWTGRRDSLSEAGKLYGIECRDVRTLADDLTASPVPPTRIARGFDPAVDAAVPAARSEEAAASNRNRDEGFKTALSELRLVKDAWEIEQMREAVASTVRGFTDVVEQLPRAKMTSERWIETTFYQRARVEGNHVGYGSICAAGHHATIMHWVRNDGPVRDGDLLLLDAGVETDALYTADITRTLPISGRFSPTQRRIYEAVYAAQEAGIAAVEPGRRFRDFHDAAQYSMAAQLVEWGLLEGPADRVLELGLQRRFTLAGTGHMLGLDVHDCSHARHSTYIEAVLEPGMILTVEPGLYFQQDDLTVPPEYRGIGVRIEDDILVTEDGNENLSAALPRRAEEVELWMAALVSSREEV